MSDPLVLYSTISRLAYTVGARYYEGNHYVWCAPCRGRDAHTTINPPSSDPVSIYWELEQDIVRGDSHSAKISSNRAGLIRGANAKEAKGKISAKTRLEIEQIVTHAALVDFKPLFLVIPFAKVKRIVEAAPVGARARASSNEFLIPELPGDRFDIIELRDER